MTTLLFLLAYFVLINIITVIYFYRDKRKAVRHEFRIPESVLFLLALMGGSPAALLSMFLFRHKTRKWKFRIGIPAILLLQCAAIGLLFFTASQIQFR